MRNDKKKDSGFEFEKLPIDSERTVNDKELLTFTNLTNLKWEFVSLNKKVKNKFGKESREVLRLSEVLKDPERFAIRDENGEVKEYVYGTDIQGNYHGKETGLKELRKEAGIAMEYLEKDEGEFLKNWEVVYAADNYKLVTDYIDYLKGFFSSFSGESEEAGEGDDSDDSKGIKFPSREDLEHLNNTEKIIKLGFSLADAALSISCNYVGLDGTTPTNISKDIARNISKNTIREVLEQSDSLVLQIIGTALLEVEKLDPKILLPVLKYVSSPISKYLRKQCDYDVDKLIKDLENDSLSRVENVKLKKDIKKALESYSRAMNMEIIEKLTLFDTGFRVLVLRKGDNIVIAYKGEKTDDNKVLPAEFYNLHIVYQLLEQRDFFDEESRISFTGYQEGADLSFLNSLIVDENNFGTAHFFYNSIEKTAEYLNFTRNHLDKDYKSNIEIVISGSEDLSKAVAVRTFYAVIAVTLKGVKMAAGIASLKTVLLTLIIWQGIKAMAELVNAAKIRRIYDELKKLGLIKSNDKKEQEGYLLKLENRIKGYMTNEFMDSDYITLEIEGGKKVDIKKEDAIYLLSKEYDDDIIKDSQGRLKVEIIHSISRIGSDAEKYILEEKEGIYQITEVFTKGLLYRELNEEEREEKLASGEVLTSIMEMMGGIQRNYINRAARIRFNYYDKRDFVSSEAGDLLIKDNLLDLLDEIEESNKEVDSKIINYLKTIPESRGIGNLLKKATITVNELMDKLPGETLINEFIFMPYISKEGYLENELRQEYIASVFKSMIQYHYEDQKKHYLHKIKYEKGERVEYSDDFKKLFGEIDLNEELLQKMEEISNIIFIEKPYSQYDDYHAAFNHYRKVLKKLRSEKEKLENKYYKDGSKKMESFKGLFTRIAGIITVNPAAGKGKTVMEYKYNPYDCVTGGILEIMGLKEHVESVACVPKYDLIIRHTEPGRKSLLAQGIDIKKGATVEMKFRRGGKPIKTADLIKYCKKHERPKENSLG
ncbi:hypothetical protein [Halocella sp. SP3-1]|uniref:hypothetical protein n=1 Tax=Halocella sp. SP3-1 TaxID=2382161 RepID=UPI000F75CE11|nr:hypothetical protein [Halocella sp. SP3-1]AZO94385.1 hypothetical protein D7D81_07095 [Halocella sp. SP3-1]